MLIKDASEPIPEGEESLWLTQAEVAERCPPCAEKMIERGIIRIRANLLYNERLQQAMLFGNAEPCEGCP